MRYRSALLGMMACLIMAGSAPAPGLEPPKLPASLKKPRLSETQKDKARIQKRRDRTIALLRFLNTRVEQVQFDDESLEDAFAWFREQGLKNIIIRWKLLDKVGEIGKDTPITLSLQDVTLGEALDLVLELVSGAASSEQDRLTYHVFDGMLKISTRADFDRHVYTRTYYVEDLLYPISLNELLPFLRVGQSFAYVSELDPAVASGAVAQEPIIDVIDTGSFHGPGDPGYGRPDFKGMREEELQKLVNLLKQVRPQSWQEGGGRGTITPFSDKLIISQTIELHEIIGGAFDQVRAVRNKKRKSGR